MRALSLLVVLLLLTGCPTDDPAVDDPDFDNDFNDVEEVDEVEMTASLQGQAGFEAISGSAEAHVRDDQTHIAVSISGAESGGTHPWHVHGGTCESGGTITGDMNAYPALEVGEDGSASAEATLQMALDGDADYHVNVHASADDLGTIVACGDLNTY